MENSGEERDGIGRVPEKFTDPIFSSLHGLNFVGGFDIARHHRFLSNDRAQSPLDNFPKSKSISIPSRYLCSRRTFSRITRLIFAISSGIIRKIKTTNDERDVAAFRRHP